MDKALRASRGLRVDKVGKAVVVWSDRKELKVLKVRKGLKVRMAVMPVSSSRCQPLIPVPASFSLDPPPGWDSRPRSWKLPSVTKLKPGSC